MVVERRQLRTYAFAYLQALHGETTDAQRKSLERYVTIHAIKVEAWYEDRTGRRRKLRDLLSDLARSSTVDYVLVHEARRVSKFVVQVRAFENQVRQCGAQVVYTSRA